MRTFLIILLALMITAFAGVVIYNGFVQFKRRKLLEAWKKFATDRGITFPENYVMLQLEKLNNHDVNTLIDFSKALDEKQYFVAMSMFSQVKSILMKTASLDDISVLLGEILQAKLNKAA